MSLKNKIGRIEGSLDGVQLSVKTWEDSGTALDEDDALASASAAIPATLFTTLEPTGTISVSQEARNIYEFKFTYEPPETEDSEPANPPETGSLVRRANCSTKSKTLLRYIDTVGVYTKDGEESSSYYDDQKWAPKKSGPDTDQGEHGDVTVDPLPETRTLDYYIPNIDLTEEYVQAIEELVIKGAFNDDEFFGFDAGTIQLVRFSLQERSTNDWELSLGFGRGFIETGVVVNDNITIPTLRPCDHYYFTERSVMQSGSKVVQTRVVTATVGQAWPLMDFSVLELPGQDD